MPQVAEIKREEIFWDCGCQKDDWQQVHGAQQPACSNCLRVARFFRMTKGEQAKALQEVYGNQGLLSSWLPACNKVGTAYVVPMDVAYAAAGWGKPPEKGPLTLRRGWQLKGLTLEAIEDSRDVMRIEHWVSPDGEESITRERLRC